MTSRHLESFYLALSDLSCIHHEKVQGLLQDIFQLQTTKEDLERLNAQIPQNFRRNIGGTWYFIDTSIDSCETILQQIRRTNTAQTDPYSERCSPLSKPPDPFVAVGATRGKDQAVQERMAQQKIASTTSSFKDAVIENEVANNGEEAERSRGVGASDVGRGDHISKASPNEVFEARITHNATSGLAKDGAEKYAEMLKKSKSLGPDSLTTAANVSTAPQPNNISTAKSGFSDPPRLSLGISQRLDDSEKASQEVRSQKRIHDENQIMDSPRHTQLQELRRSWDGKSVGIAAIHTALKRQECAGEGDVSSRGVPLSSFIKEASEKLSSAASTTCPRHSQQMSPFSSQETGTQKSAVADRVSLPPSTSPPSDIYRSRPISAAPRNGLQSGGFCLRPPTASAPGPYKVAGSEIVDREVVAKKRQFEDWAASEICPRTSKQKNARGQTSRDHREAFMAERYPSAWVADTFGDTLARRDETGPPGYSAQPSNTQAAVRLSPISCESSMLSNSDGSRRHDRPEYSSVETIKSHSLNGPSRSFHSGDSDTEPPGYARKRRARSPSDQSPNHYRGRESRDRSSSRERSPSYQEGSQTDTSSGRSMRRSGDSEASESLDRRRAHRRGSSDNITRGSSASREVSSSRIARRTREERFDASISRASSGARSSWRDSQGSSAHSPNVLHEAERARHTKASRLYVNVIKPWGLWAIPQEQMRYRRQSIPLMEATVGSSLEILDVDDEHPSIWWLVKDPACGRIGWFPVACCVGTKADYEDKMRNLRG